MRAIRATDTGLPALPDGAPPLTARRPGRVPAAVPAPSPTGPSRAVDPTATVASGLLVKLFPDEPAAAPARRNVAGLSG